MAGKVIAIEGLDGVGKSTQVELLKQKYEELGGKVYVHHFPSYGTKQGSFVERFLSGDFKDLAYGDVASFYIVDFVITWYDTLKQYYDDNYIIILDRSWLSTILYQGSMAVYPFSIAASNLLNFLESTGLPVYNTKYIFLTGKFDTICEQKAKLLQETGAAPDEIEKRTDLLRTIGNNANKLARDFTMEKVNVTSDGEMRSIEDIGKEIFERSLV